MAECLQTVYAAPNPLSLVITVDSHGLYSTITTLHEGTDYRLRPTVARMRDSFETGEIYTMQCIPGPENISDALTKSNIVMFRKLNKVLASGKLAQGTLAQAKRH